MNAAGFSPLQLRRQLITANKKQQLVKEEINDYSDIDLGFLGSMSNPSLTLAL